LGLSLLENTIDKPKKKYRVWLNKNLSSTLRVLENFREVGDSERFELICSHPDANNPVAFAADLFEQEPGKRSTTDSAYVDYCLALAKRHKVDLFIPGRRLLVLAEHKERFEAAGVKLLLPADSTTLRIIDNKALLYKHLANTEMVAIPAYATVCDWDAFESLVLTLQSLGHQACFKPTVGIYGMGFHAITSNGTAIDRFLAGDSTLISLDEAGYYLRQRPHFRELLVMQYLPGDEHSVDCLAVEGQLKVCVSRVKSQKEYQVLEDNPELFEQVRQLTDYLKLNGLFNIQFKDDAAGKAHLLEINARMSGGLPMACLSGINFLYWAVKLALEPDDCSDIPEPKRNLKVRDVSQAIALR